MQTRVGLSAFLIFAFHCDGSEPLEKIFQKARSAHSPSGEFSFTVRVKDYDNQVKLRQTVYRVYRNEKSCRVETLSPIKLSGRKLLLAGGLWLYLPTLRYPMRVSLQQRLTGEVSNGDVAQTNFFDDYHPKPLKTAKASHRALQLLLLAKGPDVTYPKVKLWVQPKTFHTLKAEFFALSGKKLKTAKYQDFQKVLGKTHPTRVIIRDAIEPGRYSVLKYERFLREKRDESFFSKEALAD